MKLMKLCMLLLGTIGLMNPEEEIQEDPTLYIVGDSTVKNGSGKGEGGLWGWGDFIDQFMDTTMVDVENHALGGTSSRTFQTKGLWKPVKEELQKGDYVLIQFGHNDSGPINDDFRARGTIDGTGNETKEIDNLLTGKHEIVHSYGWYIQKIITDTKEKGAIPIVISPIPRNIWKNGKIPESNDSYSAWAQQVAEQEDVTFIDLNDKMIAKLNTFGEDQVTGTYFYNRDHTHTTARGAALAASLISEGLQKSGNSLKNYVLNDPEIHLPQKKNIFIIGDSTVADNNETLVGWGVALDKFLDTTRVNVYNKARGGRSSRTFRNEGLWKTVKDSLQEGDFVLIQFGHNDGGHIDQPKYRGSLKGMGDETQVVKFEADSTEIVHTYGWYIKKYIEETIAKGATPVVFSMIPRNQWKDGKIVRADRDYGKWAEEAVRQIGGFFVDLNDSIAQKYEELGKTKVKEFFPKDHTHTNLRGAKLNALTVAEALENLEESNLRDYIYLPENQK